MNKSTYKLKVKKLNSDAILPQKAHMSDAGWDLFSSEEIIIPPFRTVAVPTGIAMEIPDSYFAKIFDRSGNALKKGFHVRAGVIDNDYIGEIKIVVYNSTPEEIIIPKGYKIAQMVFLKTYYLELEEVDELHSYERQDKGFGSTGYTLEK